MSDLKYWLWLTTRRGMDSVRALTVLDYFLTPERAYCAGPEEYEHLPLRPGQWQGLLDKSMDRADQILADCDRLGVDAMTFQDAAYPQRLRQIADPPAVLYIKGRRLRLDEEAAIAVVGSREPSQYGQQAAQKLAMELAAGGAVVVSGIAQGIDTCAIQGALKGGGPVVALLPGGLEHISPWTSRFLAQDVAAVGALISEYPPDTETRPEHYRPRNRILSGLSLGVLAVECRPFGGTMLTVGHAIEQDRDVFAVPGAIDARMSDGANQLIQQGAKLVTCGRDILEEYWDRFPAKLSPAAPLSPQVAQARLSGGPPPGEPGPDSPPAGAPKGRQVVPRGEQKARFTDDELAILAALAQKPLTADQVVEATQIPARYVLSALTMLQVQQAVEEQPGRRFYALVELEE